MHLSALPSSQALVSSSLPEICAAALTLLSSNLESTGMRLYNALVIRYSGDRAMMPAHSDHSLVTVNIALNDRVNYQGGGTWFQALTSDDDAATDTSLSTSGRVIRLTEAGDAVVHAGSMYHSGAPTTSGSRWVLALFLHHEGFCDFGSRLSGRAEALLDNNRTSLAKRALEMAMTHEKEYGRDQQTEILVQRATAARRLGDRAEAARLGAEAVELGMTGGDESWEAHYNLACDLRELGAEISGVIDAFGAAVTVGDAQGAMGGVVDEKRGAGEEGLGRALRDAGDFEGAGLALERALGWLPERAEIWAELGVVMAELREMEAALVCQRQMQRFQK